MPVRSLMNFTIVEMSTSLKFSTTPFAMAGMGAARNIRSDSIGITRAIRLFNGTLQEAGMRHSAPGSGLPPVIWGIVPKPAFYLMS